MKIGAATLRDYPVDTLFVVYCAGPHCNGAHRAALRLARLGRIERTDTQNPAHADLELWLDREEDIPAIAQAVLGSGAQLYALTPRRADLETLFLELVGHSGDAAQVQEAAHA